jgi:GR25 family glycosyltransferase involved in LPS biosynthesis
MNGKEIEKIFICHYSKLENRRRGMLRQEESYKFCDVEWITEDAVKNWPFQQYYNASEEFLGGRVKSNFGREYRVSYHRLTRGEIEITLQHIAAYQKIVAENLAQAIIFEDDVILKDNFRENIARCVKLLPEDYDVFYFGQGCFPEQKFDETETREKYADGSFTVYKKENRQSRFTDSYLISRKAAETLLAKMIPFCFPIDWELNYQQFVLALNIYWVYPTLTYQGSGFGEYKSNLRWRKWRQFLEKVSSPWKNRSGGGK